MSGWDEIAIGETRSLGSHLFTAEKIAIFARMYDPQPFHLDEDTAKESILGGLCASGWHTASVFMRLNVDTMKAEIARRLAAGLTGPEIGPSPGFRNLRWPRPVFAGDTISFEQTITGKRVTASRPGWGLVETANGGVNEKGETVFAFDGAAFIGLV